MLARYFRTRVDTKPMFRSIQTLAAASSRLAAHYPQVGKFMRDFGLQIPIIQAPMAGADNNSLAVQVAKLGGLGSRGMGYSKPEVIQETITSLSQETENFSINLFIPQASPAMDSSKRSQRIQELSDLLHTSCAKLQVEAKPFQEADLVELFRQQLDIVIRARPKFVSTTFGHLPDYGLQACRDANIKVINTATTVAEAIFLAELGCDAIVAQGLEAGGHRGSIEPRSLEGQMPTLDLVAAIVDKVNCPVIAAGGIRDGATIAACLEKGASAVQIGTAFLVCEDCTSVSAAYKNSVLGADSEITTDLSGRCARGVRNELFNIMEQFQNECPEVQLPYPIPHLISAPYRAAANKQQAPEFMALWSGSSSTSLKPGMTVESLVNELMLEAVTQIPEERQAPTNDG